jgi:hypothetical protein
LGAILKIELNSDKSRINEAYYYIEIGFGEEYICLKNLTTWMIRKIMRMMKRTRNIVKINSGDPKLLFNGGG